MIKEFFPYFRDGLDLVLLFLIWKDSRKVRILEEYVAERRAEREAKLQQLAKAREAKALKADVKRAKELSDQVIDGLNAQ